MREKRRNKPSGIRTHDLQIMRRVVNRCATSTAQESKSYPCYRPWAAASRPPRWRSRPGSEVRFRFRISGRLPTGCGPKPETGFCRASANEPGQEPETLFCPKWATIFCPRAETRSSRSGCTKPAASASKSTSASTSTPSLGRDSKPRSRCGSLRRGRTSRPRRWDSKLVNLFRLSPAGQL